MQKRSTVSGTPFPIMHTKLRILFYALNNNLHRTFRRALSTVGTLLVVDDRHIIIHMDRIELTLLRT